MQYNADLEDGIEQKEKEMIVTMLNNGADEKTIHKLTNISLEDIEKIKLGE